VTDDRLAARGFEHGLDAYIIKNAGLGQISSRMMATAVEAIIGAVFEDTNRDYEAVRRVMDNLDFFDHPLLSAINRDSLPIPQEGAETTLGN
jgi:ribonuclease-3